MQFKYNFSTRGRGDLVPIVDVTVTNPENDEKVDYPCMVDSGAFMNVFHSDIADVLGLDLTKVKPQMFSGVGDKKPRLEGKPYIVNLMVAQKGKKHSFDAYVLFSNDIDPNGLPLLGRSGFFNEFDSVCFEMRKGIFYFNNN
jgi:hypothetical protein